MAPYRLLRSSAQVIEADPKYRGMIHLLLDWPAYDPDHDDWFRQSWMAHDNLRFVQRGQVPPLPADWLPV